MIYLSLGTNICEEFKTGLDKKNQHHHFAFNINAWLKINVIIQAIKTSGVFYLGYRRLLKCTTSLCKVMQYIFHLRQLDSIKPRQQ